MVYDDHRSGRLPARCGESIDAGFFAPWLRTMQRYGNHPGIAVGEYWSGDASELTSYLHDCNHCMMLFDVALHFRFEQASKNPEGFDLRGLAADTLYEREPTYACTFVDNHDTQPGQALESWVQPWFKPLAYACILLRDNVLPCVFFGDYYGVPHDLIPPMRFLPHMVWIRAHLLGIRWRRSQAIPPIRCAGWWKEITRCAWCSTPGAAIPIDRFAMRRSPRTRLSTYAILMPRRRLTRRGRA